MNSFKISFFYEPETFSLEKISLNKLKLLVFLGTFHRIFTT